MGLLCPFFVPRIEATFDQGHRNLIIVRTLSLVLEGGILQAAVPYECNRSGLGSIAIHKVLGTNSLTPTPGNHISSAQVPITAADLRTSTDESHLSLPAPSISGACGRLLSLLPADTCYRHWSCLPQSSLKGREDTPDMQDDQDAVSHFCTSKLLWGSSRAYLLMNDLDPISENLLFASFETVKMGVIDSELFINNKARN